jgi:DNA-binding response OmpR family regulator
MMRVGAIIKRSKSASSASHDTVRYDGLTVDFTSRTVCVNGEKVEMTPKEYELLFYFIRNEGIALTRERLITEVWGYDFYGDDRTLDSHIKLLRKSLGEYSRFIVTLRSVGYRFDGEKKD